jgi:RimJ/RimL family protein N-acetyltransferase
MTNSETLTPPVLNADPRVRIVPFPGFAGQYADPGGLNLRVRQWEVETAGVVFGDGLLGSQDDLGRVYEYYVRPGGGFWYAEDTADGGRLVGIVGLRKDPPTRGAPRSAELKRWAVDPAWHNQGIGKRLLRALLDDADELLEFDEVYLTTGPGEHARPIYERFGFVVTGLSPHGDFNMMRRRRGR